MNCIFSIRGHFKIRKKNLKLKNKNPPQNLNFTTALYDSSQRKSFRRCSLRVTRPTTRFQSVSMIHNCHLLKFMFMSSSIQRRKNYIRSPVSSEHQKEQVGSHGPVCFTEFLRTGRLPCDMIFYTANTNNNCYT